MDTILLSAKELQELKGALCTECISQDEDVNNINSVRFCYCSYNNYGIAINNKNLIEECRCVCFP